MTRQASKGLHKADIKAAIHKRGWTLIGLSLHWGLDRSAISTALNRSWTDVEAKIAEFLKMKPQAIWPERYDQDGNPLKSKRVMGKNSRKETAHNDQFDKAA
ncbi:MAG: helix-turn-helix domain-containing protein [Methylocystaceae bacterium]|nr:helix-turn-helix domain-containing protein [Methylocystaceae bacterium]